MLNRQAAKARAISASLPAGALACLLVACYQSRLMLLPHRVFLFPSMGHALRVSLDSPPTEGLMMFKIFLRFNGKRRKKKSDRLIRLDFLL